MEDWIPVAPCQNCGGAVSVRQGQSCSSTVTLTFEEGGRVLTAPGASWCGDCIDEWNARMGSPLTGGP